MIFILLVAALIFLFVVIDFRLYLFLTPHKRLPILMYHQIARMSENELTISTENLENQFRILQKKGYKTLFFSELIPNITSKNIILTFDDGYLNNKEFLLPLLSKYGFKATIFLPTKLIEENRDGIFMDFEVIRNLDKNLVEIGLHSHSHQNYSHLSVQEAEKDLQQNMATLESEKIPYTKVLAYPYGKFKKSKDFFRMLKLNELSFALRIGNKINLFPAENPYTLTRIDIKGSTTLNEFRWKLILGKLKLF